MSKLKLFVSLLLFAVALVVVFQNTQEVETQLLWITVTMPRALLLIVTLFIGLVLGLLLSSRVKRKKKKRA